MSRYGLQRCACPKCGRALEWIGVADRRPRCPCGWGGDPRPADVMRIVGEPLGRVVRAEDAQPDAAGGGHAAS